MKKFTLTALLLSASLTLCISAQAATAPIQKQTGVKVTKVSKRSIRSEMSRTIKTYEQNGRKIAIKETLDGKRRFKTFADSNNSLKPTYISQKEMLDNIEGYSLAEDFEGFAEHIYDENALEWLPEGWTSINAHPNYDDPYSLWYSWYITEPSISKGAPINPQSKYIAYIQYDEYEESDEWLITKPVQIKEEDYLFFDLSYIPYFLFYNFENKDDGLNATLIVKISTDGGESWTQLLDVADLEYSTQEELEDSSFRRFRIDVSEYVGQTVLIAFQYVGIYGDSMQLDDVYVRPMSPTALYNRPQGTFLSGVNHEWEAYATTSIFAPAFKDLQWNNYSNEALECEWENAGENYDTDNFTANYSIGEHNVPTLTAAAGSAQSTYTWNGTITAGRTMTIGTLDSNNNLLTILTYNDVQGPKNYIFGSCELDTKGYHVTNTEVMNVFEKPASPMLISGVDVILATFEAPDDAIFRMRAIAITETGELGETLATATLKASDITTTDLGGYYGYGMHFEFMQEVGGTTTPARILINQPMAYVLDGFDKEDIVIGVVSNKIEQTFDSSARVTRILSKEGEEDITDISSMGNYSLAMSLCNAAMPTIGADSSIEIPGTSGTAEITVYSTMFMADGIDCTINDNATWLTTGKPADRASNEIAIPITFEALPEGISQRKATLTVSTLYASPITIEVIQDKNVSGITAINTEERLTVNIDANNVTFNYAKGKRGTLSIYNIQGLNLLSTELTECGQTAISTLPIEKGVYIAFAKYDDGSHEVAKFIIKK